MWSRGRSGPLTQIEALYFEACPNHEALLPHLRELLKRAGVSSTVEFVNVSDAAAAERERFLGSPTLRIDRRDVGPAPRLGPTSA